MGLMPANGTNPFVTVDRRTVLGTFKASGSRDTDVLHAQKETLLGPYKNLRKLAMLSFIIGGLFTITIFMAWFGIPVLLGAWWLWSFQAKQQRAVEDGYTDYVATLT